MAVHHRQGLRRPAAQHVCEIGGDHGGDLDCFAETAPEAFEFVSNVSWSNSFLNGLLAWKDENQATTREAAEHFLKNNEDVWGAWVPAEVAAKVKAALM